MKSDYLPSSSSSITEHKHYKLIRNSAIAVIIILVVYLTGSYGYELHGEYTNDKDHKEFQQSGGNI